MSLPNALQQVPNHANEHERDASREGCTDICTRLAKLSLIDGKLPNHAELLAKIGFTEQELEAGLALGTLQDLRQRQTCPFCQLVLTATADADGASQSPEDEPVRVLLFPGEQSFRLSYPSRLGTRLAFVADNDLQISGPDSARAVTEPQVNPVRILSWLNRCEDHHGSTCYPQLGDVGPIQPAETKAMQNVFGSVSRFDFGERVTSNFRVIDLELGCVVPQVLDAKYVALSYVWGQLPMFRLLESNVERLSRQGGLDEVLGELPQTILDAMEFVKSLGVRFLWVDALCLIQDDQGDVEVGIEVMNSVYSGSYFTVIAASGKDARSGLPGVRPGSRRVMQSVSNLSLSDDGLKMTVQHSIDWHLRRSVYKQRGWTLQELVLPRRTIIFINNQVYFRCQEANWSEETTADAFTHHLDPDDGNISRIPDALDEGGVASWWAYQKLFEEYSSREIRFDGDALRATAGIMRPLCAGMETRMLEGLPANYLDNALLFMSSLGNLRRRPSFPSYSWAGWAGSVIWPRENYVWYDGEGSRTWDTSNLFRWFAGKTFVNWSYICADGQQRNLMSDAYHDRSRLGVLVEEISRRFPQYAKRLSSSELGKIPAYTSVYCSGWGSGPFHPKWDLQPRGSRAWTPASIDLANGQAEFNRLVRKIDMTKNKLEYLSLTNWMASRRCQVRRARLPDGEAKESQPARSIGRDSDRLHYRFRSGEELTRRREDKREENAKRYWEKKMRPDMTIPEFPPYAVLSFRTISISLILGQRPDATTKTPKKIETSTSSFHRIRGVPLLSPSGETVGSLHPDNLGLLPPSGESIECLLMSRCQALTWSSALGSEVEADLTSKPVRVEDDAPRDLFWALCIIWKAGIAERRGVAQLLSTAVGKACAPGPEIKDILLG